MIIHPKFIYIHFPKTAGTAIDRLFKKYFSDVPDLVVDSSDSPDCRWHDTIAQRSEREPGFHTAGRTVVSGFRRLPAWLESRFSFERSRSPHLEHPLELLPQAKFMEADGSTGHADIYGRNWLAPEILVLQKVQLIRVEHFSGDFRRIFGQWLDVERIPEEELKLNINVSPESSDVAEVIKNNLDAIYRECPHWSAIERFAFWPEART